MPFFDVIFYVLITMREKKQKNELKTNSIIYDKNECSENVNGLFVGFIQIIEISIKNANITLNHTDRYQLNLVSK